MSRAVRTWIIHEYPSRTIAIPPDGRARELDSADAEAIRRVLQRPHLHPSRGPKIPALPDGLTEVISRFGDDDACMRRLEEVRWGGHPTCPECGHNHIHRNHTRARGYGRRCARCGRAFSAITNTIFSRANNLPMWFAAIWVEMNDPDQSTRQLARILACERGSLAIIRRKIADGYEANRDLFEKILAPETTQ